MAVLIPYLLTSFERFEGIHCVLSVLMSSLCAELEDVSYAEEEVTRATPIGPGISLPPLPKEVPPPQPPPEYLRKRTHAELLDDFHSLLAEKGVRPSPYKLEPSQGKLPLMKS